MTAQAHFMHQIYGPFDRPLRIVPPKKARRRRLHEAARRSPRPRGGTCVIAPTALADGDPASDVLIGQKLFYPYYSNTPKAGRRTAEDDDRGREQAAASRSASP